MSSIQVFSNKNFSLRKKTYCWEMPVHIWDDAVLCPFVAKQIEFWEKWGKERK